MSATHTRPATGLSFTGGQIEEFIRRSRVYDALMGEPGPQTLETLTEWKRTVESMEYSVRSIRARVQRIEAHIDSKTDKCVHGLTVCGLCQDQHGGSDEDERYADGEADF